MPHGEVFYSPLVCRGIKTLCTLFGFNVYTDCVGINLFSLIYGGFLGPKATDGQRRRYPAFLFVLVYHLEIDKERYKQSKIS